MMDNFKELSALPGPAQYQAWVKERLETLSVREGYILTAALMRAPPRDAEEAVDCFNVLEDYDVFLAGSYEELGRFYLQQFKCKKRLRDADAKSYRDSNNLETGISKALAMSSRIATLGVALAVSICWTWFLL